MFRNLVLITPNIIVNPSPNTISLFKRRPLRQNLCFETKHFITTDSSLPISLHLLSFSTNPSCRIVQHYSMNSVPGRQLMVKGTDGFFQQRTLPWIINSPWTNNNNIGNCRSNLAQHRNKDKSWTNNDQYLF